MEIMLAQVPVWGVPPPPQGYFGRKIPVINRLRSTGPGKIFITNELLLKYCIH